MGAVRPARARRRFTISMALKPAPSPTMASRLFAKLSRIRSIAPVNLKTSVPRCSAYAYASAAVFFFASWAKREETWKHDEFPRARTSFERALHFRTTRFASVGDILKAVGKQDRRDFRYSHLAFAIRTDFHRGYYRTCQLGTHDVSFRPT